MKSGKKAIQADGAGIEEKNFFRDQARLGTIDSGFSRRGVA